MCLLNDDLTDRSRVHSSLDSLEDVESVLFFTRVMHLNEGGLPEGVVQRCDKLHWSVDPHVNVSTFLGLIVEEHIQPHVHSVAHIFEEYVEGDWYFALICMYVQV